MLATLRGRAGWPAGLLGYAFAVALVLAADAARWWLTGLLGPLPVLATFYPATVLGALAAGAGPGVLATLLALLLALLPVPPFAPPPLPSVAELLSLILFLAANLILCLWRERPSWQRAPTDTLPSAASRQIESLAAEKEWLSQVLASIADEVYFTDTQQRYLYANEAAMREFAHQSVQGMEVRQVVANLEVLRADGTVRPVEEAPPLRALRGEIIHDEEQIVRTPRTGELRHRQVSAAPVRAADGRIVGSVSVVRDITERKRSEAALREADRRKDVFLATLAHELRNPLAPIRAAARLLESPALTPEQLRRCQIIIARQVTHMASLLDDLLDVSRLTRGQLSLRRADVPLRQLVDSALETVQPLLGARRHHLQLALEVPELTVHVDAVRLTQVLTNLLTNAAKYTEPGGSIALGAVLRPETLELFVRDSGMGLDPPMLEAVFEMFVRAPSPGERADAGLGIGLALVRALVELHGGQVRAESAGRGHGSTFTVSLPRELIATRDGTGGNRAGSAPAGAVAAARRHILIADDNEDAAESLSMLLRLSGHEVCVAHSGEQALELARRRPPQIALLDLGMPGMSGHELARRLRAEPWGRHIRLVAVTGWGQDEDRRRARAAGFDHHLTKPADPAALEAVLAAGPLASSARAAGEAAGNRPLAQSTG